jgi:hypothetical protein
MRRKITLNNPGIWGMSVYLGKILNGAKPADLPVY